MQDKDIIKKDNDAFMFNDEDIVNNKNSDKAPWKIIISDDDEEVHIITKLVLSDYIFDDRKIECISAYSGEETKRLIEENPDTAIIFLDVVMEEEDSGLKVAEYIRKKLKNNFVRIILRTGQPGKAPEQKVIMEYEINDYKEKTELTAKKLFTSVTVALRSYRDLKALDKTKSVMELIIKSSECLFEVKSVKEYVSNIFSKILEKMELDKNALFLRLSDKEALPEEFYVLAGTGKFKKSIGKSDRAICSGEICNSLRIAFKEKKNIFIGDAYIGYIPSKKGTKNFLYITGCRKMSELDKNLIQIFSTNLSIAFENINLARDIIDTQKDVILALGEVVGSLSVGTNNHVRRVAEYSEVIAKKYGLNKSEQELLKVASPMHDLGKIGIPDSILNKKDVLTEDEYIIIKKHSGIGYDILKKSHRDILLAAGIMARQHHERWDGNGYPQGLKGNEIHIFGRIICLADVFDALIHQRPYKEGCDIDKVKAYIKKESGFYFDPDIVDIFFENVEKFISISKKYKENDEKK